MDGTLYRALPLASRIAIAALPFLGYRYDEQRPGVPYLSGSMPPARAELPRKTACSTFTAALLMAVYPDAPWTLREYGDLQSFRDRFDVGGFPLGDAPIAAVERMCVGMQVDRFMAGSWHLVQGWRRPNPPGGGGHAFLVYAEDHHLMVLEASGTGTSGIGPQFTRKVEEDLHSRYALVHIARLADG